MENGQQLSTEEKLQQTAQKFKEDEQEKLVIDFDEAVEEQKDKAIEVHFDGNVYNLPPDAPAWLPLYVNRYMDENGVLDDKKNLELIRRLLGKKFAEKILDEANNFVSLEAVNDRILMPVMNEWGLNSEDVTEDQKKMISTHD